ncbi:MAG: hypothetical protein ACRD0P_11485 [Stackebrandtia sp.]
MRIRTKVLIPLAAAGAAAALLVPAGLAYADYGDPITPIDGSGLTWHPTSQSALDTLDGALPNVGVASVLDSANHPMPTCGDPENNSLPIDPKATAKLCWDSGDAETEAWNPQGITTSGDADDDGAWGADELVLSAWNFRQTGVPADDSQWNGNNERHNDARVAFIDYTDPDAAKYRWVYLVKPQDGGKTFSAAEAHVGGMAWYGDKLYVTEVGNRGTAIRVFSMKHILQTTSAAGDQIGKTGDKYAAYGYQYAMPEVGYYTYNGGKCTMDSDTGQACFSAISLDRSTSPDSLVSTEYFADQDKHGRLYRYDMGPDYLLKTDGNGSASSSQAYRSYVGNMQGVVSRDGYWYVAHSSATRPGSLWRQNTSESIAATCGDPATDACWSMHPEALTYNVATDLLWSQTEWSRGDCQAVEPKQNCGRVLYGVPLSSIVEA